ncbi:MAG TPA: hypothetical protein VGI21_02075 [Streptosporangiaceae bacterium]
MIKVQPPAGQRSFRRACWAVAALAVLAGASACARGSSSASGPSAIASAAGSRPATAEAIDRSDPGAVLTDWLHQVVVADYHAACRDMGEPASAGTAASPAPAPAPAPGACPSTDTVTALKSFHGNFVTDGLKVASQLMVWMPAPAGASVTVNGTSIMVGRSNLTALMTAHSTGVKPGELKLSFTLSNIGGQWYVSDLNLDV